ncbi:MULTISPECIES: ead/Ea22-like family protein [Enterobacter cloacae complex]|uniref:ead/Ea22-like family protein n=1 Tax=Enterobacter cloacae complex TaxID=354276 RepID=UPI0005E5D63A|nr:ead/Ea22-like family protein [Enterobacter hormaechei]ASB82168.1 hypothetical protein AM383_01585 [Enterobacter cloacae complex sp.]KJH95921.1 hypothetical protein UO80_02275 [Enterobacter hormaechei]KJH97077.1 hypothetical protein UO96_06670 [Enterobacter hormaechei]KJI04069.1 hypothetical protein UO86_10085 [Enterobacter hormaechei]KJI95133.1 hypothetical protein UP05_02450 [Enterobacter hormaechei]
MSNIDKQALIAKIKKQTESFDTVVLKEDEANALLDELEAKDKRIAELEAREVVLPQPAQWDISEVLLDKGKVVSAIRAAGIRINEEG